MTKVCNCFLRNFLQTQGMCWPVDELGAHMCSFLARLWKGTPKTGCNTPETGKRRSRVSML
jgi:hypothetical protein